jgi:TonB family protein
MKTTLPLIFIFLTLSLSGQDTIFYDINKNEVTSLHASNSYKVLEQCQADTEKTIEKQFHKSGQQISEIHYKPYEDKVYDGKRIQWYENGQLHMDIDYKEGALHGDLFTFWENGQPKRRDKYFEGELIEGQVWNSDGKEALYYSFLIHPEFPGGIDKLFQFLSSNLQYPRKEFMLGIEGKVIVNFTVDEDGAITKVRIKESVSKGIDNEAMRVVKKFPNFMPGMEDGLRISFQYNLPVWFRFN